MASYTDATETTKYGWSNLSIFTVKQLLLATWQLWFELELLSHKAFTMVASYTCWICVSVYTEVVFPIRIHRCLAAKNSFENLHVI